MGAFDHAGLYKMCLNEHRISVYRISYEYLRVIISNHQKEVKMGYLRFSWKLSCFFT